mmetsp:Transcript_5413/g.23020  ORF Transcript_5413/g.23020 Transcript_5413/m.23020 type:complete len:80 (-) Transcript_5413:512-751(-)
MHVSHIVLSRLRGTVYIFISLLEGFSLYWLIARTQVSPQCDTGDTYSNLLYFSTTFMLLTVLLYEMSAHVLTSRRGGWK